ncbi:MAG TPA: glycerol-3-phosphate dehydrogenase/oxidase [Pseudonocardiaceae bacterium]
MSDTGGYGTTSKATRSGDSSLTAQRRARELAEVRSGGHGPVDLLVIGGGVTGAGVALDAASRGLSVVLAERHDLAFGTSRWSSKLVHGGLRYLASGAVGIAHESAVERGILLTRVAPHLVRPLPQIIPLLPRVPQANAALMRAGVLGGDLLRLAARTSHQSLPWSRIATRAEVRRYAPGVQADGLRGGILSWDGQLEDDARLVVAIARTAAAYGARILTHCAAVTLTGEVGVLRDELTEQTFDVPARMVINATGVWAGQLAAGVPIRPSRGTHLVLPGDALPGLTAGLTVPVEGSISRYVFALPAPDDRVYVGLTDVDTGGEIAEVPTATDAEIDFLLDSINPVLARPLSRADLIGTFSGLRPLLDTGAGNTADISRRHAVITASDGLVTITGGKLTTYRRMAQDAVDAALARSGLAALSCRTQRLPLVGAASPAELARVRAPRRLVRRYGTEAATVIAEAGEDPAMLAPVAEGIPVTPAELRYAVRHEGALDEDDLLDRRTRIGLSPADRERALPAAQAAVAQTAQP